MIRCGFVALTGVFSIAALLPGQSSDSNPGHAPSVFMGGPKYTKDKAAKTRSVKGTVTDSAGKPLNGALVVLTNGDTHEKLNFFTKEDGRYHFDDLSFTTDYALLAHYKNLNSEKKTLSQYDRTPHTVRMLQIPSEGTAPSSN